MALGSSGVNAISLQRLALFKALQDFYNTETFLGIHATADAATVLETARTIDGVSFDGSADITLPTKVVHLWSETVSDTTTYYAEAGKTTAVTTFDAAKIYIDHTTSKVMYWDGSALVAAVAVDSTPRIAVSEKGVANGVATLDNTGLVPSSQLPSYVDDVLEIVVETTGEPAVTKYYLRDEGQTGNKGAELTSANAEKGKIYVDPEATVDGTYRWSGSAMVKIGSTVSTAQNAINDVNGDQIDTTYMKKSEFEYTEATEAEIKALFPSATVSAYEASLVTP